MEVLISLSNFVDLREAWEMGEGRIEDQTLEPGIQVGEAMALACWTRVLPSPICLPLPAPGHYALWSFSEAFL